MVPAGPTPAHAHARTPRLARLLPRLLPRAPNRTKGRLALASTVEAARAPPGGAALRLAQSSGPGPCWERGGSRRSGGLHRGAQCREEGSSCAPPGLNNSEVVGSPVCSPQSGGTSERTLMIRLSVNEDPKILICEGCNSQYLNQKSSLLKTIFINISAIHSIFIVGYWYTYRLHLEPF